MSAYFTANNSHDNADVVYSDVIGDRDHNPQ